MKSILKKIIFYLLKQSLDKARGEQNYNVLFEKLRDIVPNLKDQYSSFVIDGDYLNTKVYSQHSFQIDLVLLALNSLDGKGRNTLIDIGDSSGNHIRYLSALKENIQAISVNSDPIAVQKIKEKGLEALQAKAEDLRDIKEFKDDIDVLTSFEMLEHLQDPIGFLKSMSRNVDCDKFVITVPYVSKSRVNLWKIDNPDNEVAFNPEVTHIFELNPEDWKKLFKFSGWKVEKDLIYYQYPQKHPLWLTKYIWKKLDFEGFFGVILSKDDTYLKMYNEH